VPEVFVAELQQALNRGEKLQAITDDGRYRFTLQRFAGTGSAAGTEAILVADGSADGLRPGSLLPVTLQRPTQQQVVSVPFSALYGADTLYVVGEDFRLQRLRVERVGEARAGADRNLLVRGDKLQPGLRIITTHLPNAMSGLKVDIAGVQSE
jgi:HlyD family secretion protein